MSCQFCSFCVSLHLQFTWSFTTRLLCTVLSRATLLMQQIYVLECLSQGLETAEEDKKASKKVQKKIAKRQDGQAARTSSGTVCWWKVACLHFISTWPMWLGWWVCPAVHMCFPLTACMRRWLLAIGFFFWHMCNPLTRYACCRYILEGNELESSRKKIQKKGKGAAA